MEYESYNDNKLVELAKQGDEKARTLLINKYEYLIKSVSRTLYLINGTKEDIIQEGRIGIFKAINLYNGKSSFKSFAYTCIKSRIYTTIKNSRAQKNEPLNKYLSFSGSEEDDVDKSFIFEDKTFGPEDSYINDETYKELYNAIKNVLSAFEKEVLDLYVSGDKYVEMAKKMQTNTKSIENAVQRIKKKVQTVTKGSK